MAADRPPLRLVHRGTIDASGLVLDERHLDLPTIHARLASRWAPGASVRRLPEGRWWLRFASPAPIDAGEAPGAPLASEHGVHCAAPGLGAAARERGAVEGSVALLSGGALQLFGPLDGEAIDAASLLDLAQFSVTVVRGPEAAPRQARTLEAARSDVRALLGDRIPPADPAAREVAAALRQGRPLPPHLSGEPEPEPEPAVRWLAGLFRALSAVLTRLMVSRGSSSLGKAASASAASREVGRTTGLVVRRVDPAGPGWLERTAARLNDLAARMMMASGMAGRVGRKQASYLGNMMQMFERGDLDQALRHAIPLGRGGDGAAPSFSLGAPAPRSELSLSAGASSSGSSVLPFAGLRDELTRLYRAAFERLDGEGRVEEAAFVLAELLGESEEAVAYLERHGRLRLAAELAEGRGLPAALVVRQWWMAGERARALLLARRHRAFPDALVRLERGDETKAEAQAFRALWADALASAGDLLGAERTLREVPGTEPLRLAWLTRACEQGGTAGHEAWLRRLALDPSCIDEALAALAPLLRDQAPEAIFARLELAEALSADAARSGPLRALARQLLRAMLADAGRTSSEPGALVRLRELFAGAALRHDWPAGASVTAALPLRVELSEASQGTTPLLDAAALPDGRALVALGEAGVLLLSRDGQRLHHFEQPAASLVLSTHGDRALALAPRGRFTRVARLDLAGRRSQPWGEVELSCWASSFDGSSWLVGQARGLLEIDALADGWSALWQLRSLDGPALACQPSSDGAELRALVDAGPDGLQLWVLDGASHALRRRAPLLPGGKGDPGLLALTDDGAVRWDAHGPAQLLRPDTPPAAIEGTGPRPEGASLSAFRGLIAVAQGSTASFHAIVGQQLSPRCAASLAGARRICARATAFGGVLADDRGRLVRVQLGAAPSLVRALRV